MGSKSKKKTISLPEGLEQRLQNVCDKIDQKDSNFIQEAIRLHIYEWEAKIKQAE